MTSRWDPARYARLDPLVSAASLPDGDQRHALHQALEWRAIEIARLEAEIGILEKLLAPPNDELKAMA